MNFRTIAQLNDHIIAGLRKLPRDIDLIVGVPRSGMLPATILALHLNVAITDVDGLLQGRLLQPGISRKKTQRLKHVRDAKKILVVDDSCLLGSQLKIVRDQISHSTIKADLIFAAIYTTLESCRHVDIFFDVCPTPRMFEWNMMHHSALQYACLDIDGVLCHDPTAQENDDGEHYLRFLNEAKPHWIPTVPVGWLVTSRLERYRPETEKWLARYDIKYGSLIMLNMPSSAERRAAGCHGRFKGEVYRSKPAQLFIESEPSQSAEIAEVACKTVFCTANREVYFPSTRAVVGYLARNLPTRSTYLAWRVISAIRRRITL